MKNTMLSIARVCSCDACQTTGADGQNLPAGPGENVDRQTEIKMHIKKRTTWSKIHSVIILALIFIVLPLAITIYTHGIDANGAFSVMGMLAIAAVTYTLLTRAGNLWPRRSDHNKTLPPPHA
jgi:hypothetical protein